MSECRTIMILLGRYFDRELSEPRRRFVEDHLKQCIRCSAELQRIHEIADAFQEGVSAPQVSADMTQRIMEKAREQVGCAFPKWDFLCLWKNWSYSMRLAAIGIATIACYVGDIVRTGQIIAELEKDDQNALLEQRRAEMKIAEAKLSSAESLHPGEIQKAEASLSDNQATSELADIDFDRQKRLLDRDLVARAVFDTARKEKAVSEARTLAAARELELAKKDMLRI